MTDTTTDPYAAIATMEIAALNTYKDKLTQFQADVAAAFAPLNTATAVPATPARALFGRALGAISTLTMDLNGVLNTYEPPVMAMPPTFSNTPTTSA